MDKYFVQKSHGDNYDVMKNGYLVETFPERSQIEKFLTQLVCQQNTQSSVYIDDEIHSSSSPLEKIVFDRHLREVKIVKYYGTN